MINNFLIPEDSDRKVLKGVVLTPAREGEEPFKEALLEKTFATHKRSPLDWAIAIAVHVAVVTAVVVIPLLFSQTIDLTHFQTTYLVNPAPPGAPPPPPPPAASASRPQPTTPRPNALVAKLFAPIAVPKAIAKPDASDAAPADAPSAGVVGGVAGGVPGGVVGGVLGGVLGSGSNQPAPPPVEQAAVPAGPLHIGGNVKRPEPISQPEPVYPTLAKIARVQGVVDIDAVIDEHGNVVKAHAMDGPALLIDAALQAVSQWKYQPTYLNGQPYPVDLVIQVTFNLS